MRQLHYQFHLGGGGGGGRTLRQAKVTKNLPKVTEERSGCARSPPMTFGLESELRPMTETEVCVWRQFTNTVQSLLGIQQKHS